MMDRQTDRQTDNRNFIGPSLGQRSNKFIYLKIAFHMYPMSGFRVYSNHLGIDVLFGDIL